MSTPEQRKENTRRVKEAVALASNGDEMAARYLWLIAQAARTLDDLVDGDNPVPHEHIIAVFHGMLVEVNQNPFFLRHRDYLTGLHQMALNAWLDANAWTKSEDATERLYAHVLRDLVGEIVPAVAYLTGGWLTCRAVSLQIRKSFKKEFHHGNV